MSHHNHTRGGLMSHTKFNLSQCAKMANVSRKTIQRKVSSGVISASRDEKGLPYVELSELLRTYPNLSHPSMDKKSHHVPPIENVLIDKTKYDDLIHRLDELQNTVNRLTMLIEHKPEPDTVFIENESTESVKEKPTKPSSSIDNLLFDLDELSIGNNLDMLSKK